MDKNNEWKYNFYSIKNLSRFNNPNQKKEKYEWIYPKKDEIKSYPEDSVLIKIKFKLKKAYISKGELDIKEKNGDLKINENPPLYDHVLKLPMIRATSWKGNLRSAAHHIDHRDKEKLIQNLFGNEKMMTETSEKKGRLYFFDTFFDRENEDDEYITPLNKNRGGSFEKIPASSGPINLKKIKKGTEAYFYLIYVPPLIKKEQTVQKKQKIKEELEFLTEALKKMFFEYGFSAKRTAGYGIIEKQIEGNIETEEKEEKIESISEISEKVLSLLKEES